MSETKRKTFFWVFKIAGIIVSCALPIWAILEKFPLWTEVHGTGKSIGAGGILIMFVLLIIFRRTVFDFAKEKLNLKHAPPIAVWLVMLILSYVLIFISNFIADMTTVFWMGFIGCAIGTFLTFIGQSRFGEEDRDE